MKNKTLSLLLGVVTALAVVAAVLGIFLVGVRHGAGKQEETQQTAEVESGQESVKEEAQPTPPEKDSSTEPAAPSPTATPVPTATPLPTATPSPTATPVPAPQTSSDGYRIDAGLQERASDGLVFLDGDHFTLYFNSDDYNAGLWGWEVTGSDSIRFYYTRANQSGITGTVFTLFAYDWGENGYENFPNYQIAGLSEDKKYVVTFATDVQINPDDPVQVEEYGRMRDWALTIDQNQVSNPFSAK